MITMISFPKGEAVLVPWCDGNDRGEFNVEISGEELGVALKLWWENERYEDINHVRAVQIQQAPQGGADSAEPC